MQNRFVVAMVVAGMTSACVPVGCVSSNLAGSGGPPTITLPREAISMMRTPGFPVGIVDSQVLATIQPDAGASHVRFWWEFEQAPGMLMVNGSQTFAARVDGLLAPVLGEALPPIETDFAVCSSHIPDGGHEPEPIQTAPSYPLLPIVEADAGVSIPGLGLLLGPLEVGLARVSGDVTSLRIVPPDTSVTTTSFVLAASMRGLSATVHTNHFGATTLTLNVDVTCTASIGAPTGPCGEVVVSCLSPVVNVSILASSVQLGAGKLVLEAVAADFLRTMLMRGVNLHFENLVGTSLAFTGQGALSFLVLTGTPTTACSPVPGPDPVPAPTRALTRLWGSLGRGELVGEFGDVIPFELVPEVKLEWVADSVRKDLLGWTQVEPPPAGSPYRTWGTELPAASGIGPANLSGIEAKAHVVRRIPRNCFQRPMSFQLLEELVPDRSGRLMFLSAEPLGEKSLMHEPPEELRGVAMQLHYIEEAIFESEVEPMLTQLDGPVCPGPNCPDTCPECKTWSRVDFTLQPPDGFEWPPGGIKQWDVSVWMRVPAPELRQRFEPQLECGYAQPVQRIVGERIFSVPSVVFHPFMLDSVEFQSAPRVRGGKEFGFRGSNTGAGGATRFLLNIAPTVESVAVRFDTCHGRDEGAPHPSQPCWVEALTLPEPGKVWVSSGFSGTSAARTSLDAVFDAAAPGPLGQRTVSVHGLLDRTSVQLYTAVPSAYRQAGVTTADFDFRGQANVDWRHDPSIGFGPPGGEDAHLQVSRRPSWDLEKRNSVEYFSDWASDWVQVRGRPQTPASYCALPWSRFATPLGFKFSAGGRTTESAEVPAAQILSSGQVDGNGLFRVGLTGSASGSTAAALTAP